MDEAGNQEAPYDCPCCKRQFCLSCGITGWHTVCLTHGQQDAWSAGDARALTAAPVPAYGD